MSGVKKLCQAENKGPQQVTNADLKEDGVYSKKESGEQYGEEK